MEKLFTLNDVMQCSGLSERTLRNYLAKGLLRGEKKDGVWVFTEEQIDAFFMDSAVRPSILAKNKALIYDFLADRKKEREECVSVIDIPDCDKTKVRDFFCHEITEGGYKNIRFTFESMSGKVVCVILRGDIAEVSTLLEKYRAL